MEREREEWKVKETGKIRGEIIEETGRGMKREKMEGQGNF